MRKNEPSPQDFADGKSFINQNESAFFSEADESMHKGPRDFHAGRSLYVDEQSAFFSDNEETLEQPSPKFVPLLSS